MDDWNETYDALIRYCRYLSKEDGYDLAHDAFLKAATSSKREVNKTYMKKAARSVWVDQWRKTPGEITNISNEKITDQRDDHTLILVTEWLVQHLTNKQLVVFVLRFGFCLKIKEIADHLNVPESTIKALLQRARAHTGTFLEQDEHGIHVPVGTKRAKRAQQLAYMIRTGQLQALSSIFDYEDRGELLSVFFMCALLHVEIAKHSNVHIRLFQEAVVRVYLIQRLLRLP
ncbi:RNA polymerase sigma factor [Geomicrobium sp. JCM 19039]|uniref:RNA polymerase sigma factor n=1 Tax=Geomicrobium sp. JCM 19039 TaxID=1460636 RepID=UPI0009DDA0F4|nr:RNA polymerase sigma factor [Geomicrobium sp. JCM 19039]